MQKQCTVLLNNHLVTVVQFGDKKVQLPSIGRDAKSIWVRFENGRYQVIDEATAQNATEQLKPAYYQKRNNFKKTTKIEETSEEVVNTEEE